MARLQVFFLAAVGLATASASISFGSPPTQPSPSYEWTYGTPVPPPGIFDKLKKGKKWGWLPSWPWKKNKEETQEVHHEITHYPVWKIHKYKGIEIRPVKVVDVKKVYPPAQVHIHPYVEHKKHIHPYVEHKKHIQHEVHAPTYYPQVHHEIHHTPQQEISAPVYHHQIPTSDHPEVHHVSYQAPTPVHHVSYEAPQKEIPSPVYHHEVNHASYQAPQKEIAAPVYHHQVHYDSPKEISAPDHSEAHHVSYQAPTPVHHVSYEAPQKEIPPPVYHHEVSSPEDLEVENQISEEWKGQQLDASSQWAQLTAPEERALLSSFIGEGHNIEMLQKLMPTLLKDKNLVNRMKTLHGLKLDGAPTTVEEHPTEKKPKTLFSSFLPSIFSKPTSEPEHQEIDQNIFESHQPQGYVLGGQVQGHQSFPELPEVQEVYAPGFQNLQFPEIPDVQGVLALHQSTPLTVVEYSNPQFQQQLPQPPQQSQAQHQAYEEQYPPYPQQNQQKELRNSYGEPIPSDSYSNPANNAQVSAPEPRAQPSQTDEASPDSSQDISTSP